MKRFGFLFLLIPTIALIMFAGRTLETGNYPTENTDISPADISRIVSMVSAGNAQPCIRVETDGRAVASAKGAFVISNKDVIVPAKIANDVLTASPIWTMMM